MKDVEKELNNLKSFKGIIEAYEEIASIRMRRIKGSVLHNRVYLEGLRRAFYHIKDSYETEIEKLRKDKKSVRNIRQTNGRTVSVLLSANTGLYGDILLKTFHYFLNNVQNIDTDLVVIGRIGYRFFESSSLANKPVKFYDISDSGLDKEDMDELLKHLVQYDKVIVYHGEFKDILVQNPTAVSISGELLNEDAVEGKEKTRYIFEPSLEQIMSFFEERIMAALFEHSIYESNLSKYASRMMSLNQATNRIEKEISNMSLETKRVKHRVQNSKQLNVLSSLVGRY